MGYSQAQAQEPPCQLRKSPKVQNWVVKEHACQHIPPHIHSLEYIELKGFLRRCCSDRWYRESGRLRLEPLLCLDGWWGVESKGQTQSGFKLQSKRTNGKDIHTDQVSVGLSVQHVCVAIHLHVLYTRCVYVGARVWLLPSGINFL